MSVKRLCNVAKAYGTSDSSFADSYVFAPAMHYIYRMIASEKT